MLAPEKKYSANRISLFQNISKIEQNTGIVYCNNKAYKIALMARVLTNKIKKSGNNDWILNLNDIEFIKIIFKEIYLS